MTAVTRGTRRPRAVRSPARMAKWTKPSRSWPGSWPGRVRAEGPSLACPGSLLGRPIKVVLEVP